MGKLRVHELAKKIGIDNKDLVEKLKSAGLDVKTHSSSVDEGEAMKVLSGEGAAAEKAPARRPRTMVRRRRGGGDEAETETQTAAKASEGAADSTPTVSETEPSAASAPEPAVETPVSAEPVVAAEASAPAAEVAAVSAAPETDAEPETQAEQAAPEETAPEAAAQVAEASQAEAAPADAAPAAEAAAPKADAEAQTDGAKGEGAMAENGAPATNVVRVIDPQAIKERLAAEGRSFQPPRPKRTFSQVREIRVLNDRTGGAPQMVDVTGTGGARPGKQKNKGGDDQLSNRERREMRAGGARDLWMNPGKKRKSGKKGKGPEITQAAQHKRVVEMTDMITVSELAHQMAVKAGQVIGKLMGMGMMVTVNQTIDYDTASIVASEFGFEVKNKAFAEEDLLNEVTDVAVDEGNLLPRAPVVTVMGHVDHGKTSLLDAIRNTNVTAGEAGGITQHIGAYSVNSDKGLLTFLDTPGHEAFTSMRARGAHVTDVVVLVVAADDGVMPQTREAINHAKDAKSPLVVAINKCDKPDSRPERVMQELTEHGLVPEEWGGDTMMVQVSALKREGIGQLLESILLQAEVLELTADPGRKAQGAIVEAQLDKGRGPVATILVQQGTLRAGDYIIAGEHSGRVRAMYDSYGEKLEEAGPSTPVQVLGLGGVPSAGDQLNAVADEKSARRVAEHRAQKLREVELQQTSRVSLENFLNKPVSEEEGHELRLLVKADVDGSVEALRQALENLTTRKVKVNIVHSGVGTITESDVNLAVASGAIIVGFNAKADAKAHVLAQHEKVDVRTYSVIYEALDEVRHAMAGLLAPKLEERSLGVAEVRALFTVPKLGTIAGSYVLEGKITRNGKIRVRRGKEVLHEGGVASLRRFKDDVRDVAAGYECGIGVTGFSSLEEGDQLECFEIQEVQAELDEALVNLEEKAPVEAQTGVSA